MINDVNLKRTSTKFLSSSNKDIRDTIYNRKILTFALQ